MDDAQSDHVEATVQRMADLHARHTNDLSGLRRRVIGASSAFAHPPVIMAVLAVVLAWVVFNLTARRLGLDPFDPLPFNLLQAVASVLALIATLLILATQRREEELARLRSQLTLQLAVLSEQKLAKVIHLLEEQRRENPLLSNRKDGEAADMARPTDPGRVLDRIIETHDKPAKDDPPPGLERS
jgi:uncharacterized membrane protein